MLERSPGALADVIGEIPYRMALAGGWIDQPFVSKLNPSPPGSMVVVGVEPTFRFMDRCGMSTSTRKVATKLWGRQLPKGPPDQLVRELYDTENAGKSEPSGSQDMIGLIYPGINRLDYDYTIHGGVFPSHIESITDPQVTAWLQDIVHFLPVAPRPETYSPLGEKHLDPVWISRLGQTGKSCFEAIRDRDIAKLGVAMNECMECWATLLPQTVHHPSLTLDLVGILRAYQAQYSGAMYSGCGGGYLLVASQTPVPGAFKVTIRTAH